MERASLPKEFNDVHADEDEDTLASVQRAQAKTLGLSLEEVDLLSLKAELKERAMMWSQMERMGCTAAHPLHHCDSSCAHAPWKSADSSAESDAAEVGLELASALDGLGRRTAALEALERAVARRPRCPTLRLARAKLLFRTGSKPLAADELDLLLDAWSAQLVRTSGGTSPPAPPPRDSVKRSTHAISRCGDVSGFGNSSGGTQGAPWELMSAKLAGDAFYIAGWVQIHEFDNHSAAYALWRLGDDLVPGDARLARQRRKCSVLGGLYDTSDADAAAASASAHQPVAAPSPLADVSAMVGAGSILAGGGSGFEAQVDAFAVAAGAAEPALALFAPATQRARVAFTTKEPLLTRGECAAVLRAVDAHVAARLGGVWGTVRKASVPTTDLAVEDVPSLVPWLRELLRSRVFPFCAACFPTLADGSLLEPRRLRVHDAFIVRYDAAFGSKYRTPSASSAPHPEASLTPNPPRTMPSSSPSPPS
jgi:tetratricopeptide (TPR) repeat protein